MFFRPGPLLRRVFVFRDTPVFVSSEHKSLLGCKQKALKFALSLALSECGEDSSSQVKSRENVQEERIGCFDVAGGDGKGTNRGEQDTGTEEYCSCWQLASFFFF